MDHYGIPPHGNQCAANHSAAPAYYLCKVSYQMIVLHMGQWSYQVITIPDMTIRSIR